MKKNIVIALLTAFILTIFVLRNNETANIYFFWGDALEAPVSMVLIITFFVGFLVGVIVYLPSIMKQKRQLKNKEKELEILKTDLNMQINKNKRQVFNKEEDKKEKEE